jgi:hypothetical protein
VAAGLYPNGLSNTLSLFLGLGWVGAQGVSEQAVSAAIDRHSGPVDLIRIKEDREGSLSANLLDLVTRLRGNVHGYGARRCPRIPTLARHHRPKSFDNWFASGFFQADSKCAEEGFLAHEYSLPLAQGKVFARHCKTSATLAVVDRLHPDHLPLSTDPQRINCAADWRKQSLELDIGLQWRRA